MTYTTSYSIILTPGERQLCLTLVLTAWDNRLGAVRKPVQTVWVPWPEWRRAARQLLDHGVALAADTLATQDPLF
jgi:hypothetical protein